MGLFLKVYMTDFFICSIKSPQCTDNVLPANVLLRLAHFRQGRRCPETKVVAGSTLFSVWEASKKKERILIGSLSGPNFETEMGDKDHQRISFGDYHFKTM